MLERTLSICTCFYEALFLNNLHASSYDGGTVTNEKLLEWKEQDYETNVIF